EHRALRVLERDDLRDTGLGIALARGLEAVAGQLLLEGVEIIAGRDLKSDARAARSGTFAQHHRVVEHAREIDGVTLFAHQLTDDDVDIIVGETLEIGRLETGMGDAAYRDHGVLLCLLAHDPCPKTGNHFSGIMRGPSASWSAPRSSRRRPDRRSRWRWPSGRSRPR